MPLYPISTLHTQGSKRCGFKARMLTLHLHFPAPIPTSAQGIPSTNARSPPWPARPWLAFLGGYHHDSTNLINPKSVPFAWSSHHIMSSCLTGQSKARKMQFATILMDSAVQSNPWPRRQTWIPVSLSISRNDFRITQPIPQSFHFSFLHFLHFIFLDSTPNSQLLKVSFFFN